MLRRPTEAERDEANRRIKELSIFLENTGVSYVIVRTHQDTESNHDNDYDGGVIVFADSEKSMSALAHTFMMLEKTIPQLGIFKEKVFECQAVEDAKRIFN